MIENEIDRLDARIDELVNIIKENNNTIRENNKFFLSKIEENNKQHIALPKTGVRRCCNKDCKLNREYLGEMTCNCREVEINEYGQCMQYSAREN